MRDSFLSEEFFNAMQSASYDMSQAIGHHLLLICSPRAERHKFSGAAAVCRVRCNRC